MTPDAITLEEAIGVQAALFRVPTSSKIVLSSDHWEETTRLATLPRRMKYKGGAVDRGKRKGSRVDLPAPQRITNLQRQTEDSPNFIPRKRVRIDSSDAFRKL